MWESEVDGRLGDGLLNLEQLFSLFCNCSKRALWGTYPHDRNFCNRWQQSTPDMRYETCSPFSVLLIIRCIRSPSVSSSESGKAKKLTPCNLKINARISTFLELLFKWEWLRRNYTQGCHSITAQRVDATVRCVTKARLKNFGMQLTTPSRSNNSRGRIIIRPTKTTWIIVSTFLRDRRARIFPFSFRLFFFLNRVTQLSHTQK